MTAVTGPSPAREPAMRALALGLLLPLGAGAACVFAFAPFGAWFVAYLALAALFYAWTRSGSPRQAALSGFVFGLGFFLTGVSWVFVSLHYYGAMPAVLAAIATFLFCAVLAVYPALAGWLTVRLARGSASRRLVLAPAAFVLCEWLRGWVFTGFPWLSIGTSQVESPLRGLVPILGGYGISLVVAAVAAVLADVLVSPSKPARKLVYVPLALLPFVAGMILPAIHWTEPAGEPVTIALLQGNIPQEMKWRDEVRLQTLADYRRMAFEAQARIVVLPETALPAFMDQLPPDYLESLREHARQAGKVIVMGAVEREFRGGEYDYYNSVVTIGGAAPGSYRKRHLVPFGEFIPAGFKWVLAVLKIPLSDFARGPASPATLEAGPVKFGVAICYEDMFGEELIDFLPGAQVLLNVSNLAWFGNSFALDQHLQASQLRALETGRWMVRSTNTGVTAAIDDSGHVVARLGTYTRGTLVARVTPRSGMTPYARWGNVPALILVAAVFVAVLRRRGR